ncbi:mucin-2-like [Physella acuta]|uniref:mucin-2-like n=1 Tax=Physella acuta TaxID=109671 RepID=UPI0027DE44C2|nr:mucin-2-like [Physella acuta]
MEIPVIHETSHPRSTVPLSASVLLTSSSSSSSSNHFLSPRKPPVVTHRSASLGVASGDMHKEEVTVTPNKPKTPAKPATLKGEDIKRSLHTRLPSTDSGIQADGGFDSLSRYRGQSFLSATSSATDSTITDVTDSVTSGYATDLQSTRPSTTLVSKVVTVPSKSFFKQPNGRPSPAPRSSLSHTVSSAPPYTATHQLSNGHGSESPVTPQTLTSPPPNQSPSPTNQNLTFTINKPLANQKTDSNFYSNHQNGDVSSTSPNQNTNTDQSKMAHGVRVTSNTGGAKSAFTRTTVLVSPTKHNTTITTSPTRGDNIRLVSISSGAPSAPDSSTENGQHHVTSSTFKVHVINTQRAGQQDTPRPSAPGCISLTRPLRLGAAPTTQVTARPSRSTTQQTPVPAPRQLDTVTSQKPQQQTTTPTGSLRGKPEVGPRPAIAPKPSPNSSPSKASSRPTTNSTTVTYTNIASASAAESTVSSPEKDPKPTEIPITHHISTSSLQHITTSLLGSTQSIQKIRTEIPVKHIETKPPVVTKPPQTTSRPTSLGNSFGRYTPDRDRPHLHPRQSLYDRLTPERERRQYHIGQPIYENIGFTMKDGFSGFNPKEGFSFDDPSTRMKHAELILKQSDELLNDALKMLSTSPLPSPKNQNGFPSDLRQCPDGERIVEGSDSQLTSEREHRVPIYDVASGKLYGGSRTSIHSEVKVSSNSDSTAKDVKWNASKERIDAALSWLKTELASLRDMDNTLIAQFKRCHETIDTLKTQREGWEGLSEEGEDGEYWDDYEISEFNRRYLDSPGGSSSSQFSPGSRDPSLQDISLPVPQLHLPGTGQGARRGSVTQDIEATL